MSCRDSSTVVDSLAATKCFLIGVTSRAITYSSQLQQLGLEGALGLCFGLTLEPAATWSDHSILLLFSDTSNDDIGTLLLVAVFVALNKGSSSVCMAAYSVLVGRTM